MSRVTSYPLLSNSRKSRLIVIFRNINQLIKWAYITIEMHEELQNTGLLLIEHLLIIHYLDNVRKRHSLRILYGHIWSNGKEMNEM